jgi:hypothetical protein
MSTPFDMPDLSQARENLQPPSRSLTRSDQKTLADAQTLLPNNPTCRTRSVTPHSTNEENPATVVDPWRSNTPLPPVNPAATLRSETPEYLKPNHFEGFQRKWRGNCYSPSDYILVLAEELGLPKEMAIWMTHIVRELVCKEIDVLQNRIDSKFDKLINTFDDFEGEVKENLGSLNSGFNKIDKNFELIIKVQEKLAEDVE